MTTKEINFKAEMACGGCSGAITRILSKIDGVELVEPNLETQVSFVSSFLDLLLITCICLDGESNLL